MKYVDVLHKTAEDKRSAESEGKGNIILDYLGTGASNIAPTLLAGKAGHGLSQGLISQDS